MGEMTVHSFHSSAGVSQFFLISYDMNVSFPQFPEDMEVVQPQRGHLFSLYFLNESDAANV